MLLRNAIVVDNVVAQCGRAWIVQRRSSSSWYIVERGGEADHWGVRRAPKDVRRLGRVGASWRQKRGMTPRSESALPTLWTRHHSSSYSSSSVTGSPTLMLSSSCKDGVKVQTTAIMRGSGLAACVDALSALNFAVVIMLLYRGELGPIDWLRAGLGRGDEGLGGTIFRPYEAGPFSSDTTMVGGIGVASTYEGGGDCTSTTRGAGLLGMKPPKKRFVPFFTALFAECAVGGRATGSHLYGSTTAAAFSERVVSVLLRST